MSKTVRIVLTTVIVSAFVVSLGWSQTAGVVISSYPSSVIEGQPFNVVVDYSADLYTYGLSSRIFLEVVNAGNNNILQVLWNDNNRLCYEGPSGQVTFTTSVSGVSSIYFRAYISPVEFNNWFVTELEGYPRDGTYPYQWTGNGVTHDIYYQGVLILADNVAGNYCYCSGITYQVFMDAYADYNNAWGYNDIYGMTPTEADLFRKEWYGWWSNKCAIEAITKYKVGYEIPYTQKEKMKAGDDVQLWRNSGSGHSVIFINWVRDGSNNITGIRYWSTQSSTNGINYNTEYFGTSGSTLVDSGTYYARKVKPADGNDWLNRYNDADTSADPTSVGAGPTPTPTPVPTLTPTPTPTPTPAPKCYVESITMSSGKSGSNYYAKATVWIKNDSGGNVSGASVYGDWSGAVSASQSGTTAGTGKVTFTSPKKKGGGTFTFCVTNVSASGLTYDPSLNKQTCNSITAP
jgi:hypothetical protein